MGESPGHIQAVVYVVLLQEKTVLWCQYDGINTICLLLSKTCLTIWGNLYGYMALISIDLALSDINQSACTKRSEVFVQYMEFGSSIAKTGKPARMFSYLQTFYYFNYEKYEKKKCIWCGEGGCGVWVIPCIWCGEGLGYGLFYVFDVPCGEWGGWFYLFSILFSAQYYTKFLYMLSRIICPYVVIILLCRHKSIVIEL